MIIGIVAGVVALAFAMLGLVVSGMETGASAMGVQLTHVALLVACIAAIFGNRWLTAAAVIASALSFVVAFGALTPALLAALSGHGAPVEVLGMWLVVLSLVLLALPIIAIALHSRDRARFG